MNNANILKKSNVSIKTASKSDKKLKDETKSNKLLEQIISPITIIIIWEVLADFNLIDTRFFPAPSTIFHSFLSLLTSGILLNDLSISLYRIIGGFIVGAVPGLIIGLTMGLFPLIRNILDPLVAATYPIPKLALMPLIMIIFGLNDLEKIIVIAIGTFFIVLMNTAAGVINLDKIYMDVARNYGASKKDYYLTVALPGALPMIFTGLKLGMGMALLLIVAAEMNGASSGIGYRIWESYNIFDIPAMFVSFIIMSILGYIFTILLDLIERVIIPWKHS
ncbi:ABC transporter permease [Thermoanaerobacterium thermosaccharolyticum]|uniref:ABC-type nitrate/sulfonate/bicarbonate transport system, permease component n=1 Tax=Thermoanaerobacterium thermosaccharolyticum M0795 TaxID=698948 RepID=L0IFM4_THETR|nr:ABC transporter permease [Thermoanaerobacterium thermosaccharolyticum]AGB18320.1 ABC-type nitrate/sulfonate/bicarbonate transport system, permease component [Thermoanaerobacterium thermosaccharolyticum M0795]